MAKRPAPAEHDEKVVLRIDSADRQDEDLSEYAYVVRDLRRVALLAGLVFALLIGLSYILR